MSSKFYNVVVRGNGLAIVTGKNDSPIDARYPTRAQGQWVKENVSTCKYDVVNGTYYIIGNPPTPKVESKIPSVIAKIAQVDRKPVAVKTAKKTVKTVKTAKKTVSKVTVNYKSSAQAVVNHLKAHRIPYTKKCEIVGDWVWLTLSRAASETTESNLKAMGFFNNKKRGDNTWCHKGGKYNRRYYASKKNPSTKYAVREVEL